MFSYICLCLGDESSAIPITVTLVIVTVLLIITFLITIIGFLWYSSKLTIFLANVFM